MLVFLKEQSAPTISEINTIWSFTKNLWVRVVSQWTKLRPLFMKYGLSYLYPRLMELIWKYLKKEKDLIEERIAEVDKDNERELRLLAGRVNSYMLVLIQFIYLMGLYEDVGEILLTLNPTKGSARKTLYLPKNLQAVYPVLSTILKRFEGKLY